MFRGLRLPMEILHDGLPGEYQAAPGLAVWYFSEADKVVDRLYATAEDFRGLLGGERAVFG